MLIKQTYFFDKQFDRELEKIEQMTWHSREGKDDEDNWVLKGKRELSL